MQIELISLTDSQANFVKSLVESGRYVDSSEVFREGLRLLQHRELEIFSEHISKPDSALHARQGLNPEHFSPPPLAEE
ncbi:MAG: type II toxin-antitoxin system ParD family antitoxin [Candidatus Thiodiazotropha sp.]